MKMILIAVGITLLLIGAFHFGLQVGLRNAPVSKYALEPYRGLGSGVLKHGTVLSEEYQGPESIAGVLDIKGVWILEERE